MHRRKLLELLEDYAAREPAEAATTRRFAEFVTAHSGCFERDHWTRGHVTGSAWVVDRSGERVLLTHHRKLDRWLQLGGHSDGDPDTLAVACREAREESGLAVKPVSEAVFDLDIHEIPARRSDPAHLHFDVRFALAVTGDEAFRLSEESLELAWVPIHRLTEYTDEVSMLRMADKWQTWCRRPE